MNNQKVLPFLFLILGFLTNTISQVGPDLYWVPFTDKAGTSFSTDKPEEFLSERAIVRRIKQNVPITTEDLPVSHIYIDSLIALGARIHCVSKWLNGAVIYSTDNALIDTLDHLSFVESPLKKTSFQSKRSIINKFCLESDNSVDYAASKTHISMLKGDFLHNLGFFGKDILIGILDAGFKEYTLADAFDSIRNSGQLIATRNIVNDTSGIEAHIHGSLILSIIAGIIPGETYGIATKSKFILVRTENAETEYLVEEYNWAAGAEFADSMGVDIIQSSLGYSVFDDPSQSHTYSDMDGKTCPSSIAASIAAKKGILVVCSAGNAGGFSWGRIIAPSDADSVLCVGAVDSLKKIAWFSSRGPSYDNRTKPDVCAMGVVNAANQYINSPYPCTGTSCSAPVISGLAACLWQAFPDATAQEIRNAIITSSSSYYSPDTAYGYGIPDFSLAYHLLKNAHSDTTSDVRLSLYPNPVHDEFYLVIELPWLNKSQSGIIEILDINGKLLLSEAELLNKGYNIKKIDYLSYLEKGYYILRLSVSGRQYQLPIIKL